MIVDQKKKLKKKMNDDFGLCSLPAELLVEVASHLRHGRLPGLVAVFLWSRTSRHVRESLALVRNAANMDFHSGFAAVYRFRIASFQKLLDQPRLDVFSPVFRSGHGHAWRLLLRPRSGFGMNHVGLFLDVPNAELLPRKWGRDTCFRLSLTHDGGNITSARICHTFAQDSNDWGLARFVRHDLLRGSETVTLGVHAIVRQRMTLPSLPLRVLSLPMDATPESYDDAAFRESTGDPRPE